MTSLFNCNPTTFHEIELPEETVVLYTDDETPDRAAMEANQHEALLKDYQAKMEAFRIAAEEEAKRLAEEEAAKVAELQAMYANYTYDASAYSMSEYEAKEWIAMKESSGRYDVYSPCMRWYGRYQLALAYFDGRYGGDGTLSPANQEIVADAYVAERYGSWVAAQQFWLAHNWY